jgi:hypothetical protein
MVLPYAATSTNRRLAMCCRPHFSKGVEASFVRTPFIAHGKPALRKQAHPTLPRPPHPVPTFVTMANAPLEGQDGAGCRPDLGFARRSIF